MKGVLTVYLTYDDEASEYEAHDCMLKELLNSKRCTNDGKLIEVTDILWGEKGERV